MSIEESIESENCSDVRWFSRSLGLPDRWESSATGTEEWVETCECLVGMYAVPTSAQVVPFRQVFDSAADEVEVRVRPGTVEESITERRGEKSWKAEGRGQQR